MRVGHRKMRRFVADSPWREMDSNFRFRARGAIDLSFPATYVPETVRVLPNKYTVATALAALVELHQNAKRSPCHRRRP
jgi:hypothetical protein